MTLKEACEQYLLYTHPDYTDSGQGDHALLWWGHSGRSGEFAVSIQPWPLAEKFSLCAEYPDDMPPDRLGQITELIARANRSDLAGALVLEPVSHRLRIEQTLDVGPDGVLDIARLRERLAWGTDAMDSLLAIMPRVIAGTCPASRACEEWITAMAAAHAGRVSQRDLRHVGKPEDVMKNEADLMGDDLAVKSGWLPPGDLLARHAGKLSPVPHARGSLTSLIGSRRENQDYGLLFRCGNTEDDPVVLAIADGLGGHPGGRAASFLACRGVADAAAGAVNTDPRALPALLREGAEAALSAFASLQPTETCLTTLIIAVATPTHYDLSWIGDGGAAIRRQDGQWVTAMTPHRGPSGLLNEVGAFLGAKRHGFWSVSAFERLPGDLLVVGTDGVMERPVNLNTFFKEALQRMAQGISVQDAMQRRLEDCVERHPLVFDDNLTLASLFTPAPRRKA